MHKRWLACPKIPREVEEALAGFSPVQRQILYRRDVRTSSEAAAFLGRVETESGDPFLLLQMEQAVDRLLKAVGAGEPITVYGDYDADGLTATALLVETLGSLGAEVSHYIPNRFDEGYGLHLESLSSLREQGAKIVVSVDCGIRSLAEAEHAQMLGLDLIITDHHHPGPELPRALAILNPKQTGDPYPFKGLAGVGLAYKLAQGLTRRVGLEDPVQHLDLVAVGTVADMASLEKENRFLVAEGLRLLNGSGPAARCTRPGLRALARIAGYQPGQVTATSIGFGLGPRLNAAGRLGSPEVALQLLLTQDADEATHLAEELEGRNRERQRLTRQMVETARLVVGAMTPLPNLLFVYRQGFDEGVLGLAAARLVEEFSRPAIVAAVGEKTTRGSARSIPGFHITDALDECADILVQHGGHSAAAGFTVRSEHLEQLIARLQARADACIAEEDLCPTLQLDAEVDLSELDGGLREFLDQLEPCGYGNPLPVLCAHQVAVVQRRPVGSDGSHLKLTVRAGGRFFDAIAFRQGHLADELPGIVDLAFHLERNVYMGVESLQLNVLDVRPSAG